MNQPNADEKVGVFKGFIRWWWRGWTDPVKRTFAGYGSEPARKSLRRLRSSLAELRLKAKENPHREGVDPRIAWGVDEAIRPTVIRNLILEAVLHVVLASAAFVGGVMFVFGTNRWTGLFGALIITPAMLVLAVTRLWRAHCLRELRIVPFRKWFNGRN